MITFHVEGEPIEVTLELHDLPRELPSGVRLRKTVSRYSGTYASVQIHGPEYKEIQLVGTLKDEWWGSPGHAEEVQANLEALVTSGGLIRMEHESVQWWGTIEADFVRHRADWIDYEIKFTPEWKEDPRFQQIFAFPDPPNSLAETLRSRIELDAEFLETGFDLGISTAWLTELILQQYSALNKIHDAMAIISGVADYAELAEDKIRLAARAVFSATTTLDNVSRRLKDAGAGILEVSAAGQLRGGQWAESAGRRTKKNLADLIALLRKLRDSYIPVEARTHFVTEGDTLQRLSILYLGSMDRWIEIANANQINNNTDLVVGQELRIPKK